MKTKRTYRTVDVEKVSFERLLSQLEGSDKVTVAIDVAKEAMVAGLADGAGKVRELVRFSHPRQTPLFVELLLRLREAGRAVEVAMEPTGVYGNALRFQLRSRDFPVFQVDPKRVHDSVYVLDGNVSQHDPKACTLIAFVHAQGLSRPWRERTVEERRVRILLKEQQLEARHEMTLYNELEATSSPSWPELNAMMSHELRWPLELLAHYPSARAVRRAPSAEVKALLCKASRGALSDDRIALVLSSAKTTQGEELDAEEEAFVARLCKRLLELRSKLSELDKRLDAMADSIEETRRMRAVVGPTAALALLALVGAPSGYASAGALEKACGLNLKERSSGMKRGKLSISKRGPARIRQLLYLAALRFVRDDPLARAWYEERTAYKGGHKVKAIVAVMRKLLRATYHVARGDTFDSAKLFDARRLRGPMDTAPTPTSTTTTSNTATP